MTNPTPDLRAKLEVVVLEWMVLAQNWDDEDRKRFEDRPFMYMTSTRVRVLQQCTDVLRHILEAR